MAGNIQADTSGNILVEFDYNNIIVVDPNKTIDDFGNIIMNLKKLNTIEKHFSFNSKDFGCPIFTKSNL